MLFSVCWQCVKVEGGSHIKLQLLERIAGPLLVGYKADYFDLIKRWLRDQNKHGDSAWQWNAVHITISYVALSTTLYDYCYEKENIKPIPYFVHIVKLNVYKNETTISFVMLLNRRLWLLSPSCLRRVLKYTPRICRVARRTWSELNKISCMVAEAP